MSKPSFKNIVISGDVGTGTSTLAKELAKKLGWKYLSAGDFFRSWFKEQNIPLWNKAAIPDEVEKKIDYEFLAKMKTESGIIFESHYGGWFAKDLPGALRILLVCDPQVATQRILKRQHTHKETPQEIEERRRQLQSKFQKLYSNDNYQDPKYFHLIIDSAITSVEEEISTALAKISKVP